MQMQYSSQHLLITVLSSSVTLTTDFVNISNNLYHVANLEAGLVTVVATTLLPMLCYSQGQ